jgi:hypothetical protein
MQGAVTVEKWTLGTVMYVRPGLRRVSVLQLKWPAPTKTAEFGRFCASTVICRDSVCFSHFTLSVSLYAPSAVDPNDISSHKPTFLSHSRRVRFQKQTVKCSRFKPTKMEMDREAWIELHFYTEKRNRHEKFEARFYIIPDDGGSTHLWNVGRQSFYTAVQPRRQLWTRFYK